MSRLPPDFKPTDKQLQDSILHACGKLNISSPYKHQEDALRSYLRGHDVIVALPTSAGKSFIFEAAPFCWDYLAKIALSQDSSNNVPEEIHTALVISPLTSLMKTQVSDLTEKGISATSFTKDSTPATYDDVANGKYSIVFAGPEILLQKGPVLLSNPILRKRICGIFVDEVHVVKQWGHDGGVTKAFRREYALLSELRSLVAAKVPIVALTATATIEITKVISTSLALRDTVILSESPNRENIKLVLHHTKETDIRVTFKWLADELREKGSECDRYIIYCRSHVDCSILYGYFQRVIGRCTDRRQQTFAMFHANTSKEVQDMVIDSFRIPSGAIRVLFSTTAFGMGVDVKSVYNIVHYGPPKSISEYVQESGRAGRDNADSISVLVHYPRSVQKSKCDEHMKHFLKEDSKCRRATVLQHFNVDVESLNNTMEKHSCCDVCTKECKCGGDSCRESKFLVETAFASLDVPSTHTTTPFQREVGEADRALLRDQLVQLRDKLATPEQEAGDITCSHLYSGKDIASGIALNTIEHIVEDCHLVYDFNQFMQRYKLINGASAKCVWDVLEDVVGTLPVIEISQQTTGSEENVLNALEVDPHMDAAYSESQEDRQSQTASISSYEETSESDTESD